VKNPSERANAKPLPSPISGKGQSFHSLGAKGDKGFCVLTQPRNQRSPRNDHARTGVFRLGWYAGSIQLGNLFSTHPDC
jgi:hypothetical protein